MANESVIRILQIVPNMQAGGLENLIMNLYRQINRNRVQFDFLVHYSKPNLFDEEIKKLGGRIHYLSFREDRNFFRYIKNLYKIFKECNYTIVHSHMASLAFIHLGVAKICGVKTRIVHSHNSSTSRTLKGVLKAFLLKLAPTFANEYFACSNSAGKYLFGNKKYYVVNNAIDLSRFAYSETNRNEIRSELGIDLKTITIGHVGRFNVQKNHFFLLNVFKKCLKMNQNMKLVLVGDGELKKEILNQIKELNLTNEVILTSVRTDVERFYSSFDVFCLPSFFEGLPVTGIEAQASGTPCLFSTEVTKEVALLSTTKFLSLNETPQKWAKEIFEMSKTEHLVDTKKYLQKYDITHEAKKLEEWYLEHI